ELQRRADRLTGTLRGAGVTKGSVVAILANDPAEAIASIIATLQAGAAFMPLETRLPPRRLAALLDQVRPSCCLIESQIWQGLREHLPAIEARVIYLDQDPGVDWNRSEGDDSGPDDLCYIYFTSGSTGQPKAIAGRLKGIDHFIRWEIDSLGLREGVRVSQLLSLSFDGSLRDLFVPLSCGGVVCVPPSREQVIEAAQLVRWLEEQRVNVIDCVPSVFRAMVNVGMTADRLKGLRYILMAGEVLSSADVGRWMDVFGERVQLINLYGTSETTMAKFCHFVTSADRQRRTVPVGKPIEGAKAIIVDEKGRPCPPGAVGEIYIRTPYRSHGYYNAPELTEQILVPNQFSRDPADIICRTGDLGRMLEDGSYEYLGRRDQQVKIRGVRVELGEVESALREHEAVEDVAVVEREDGSGYNYLSAYLVLGKEVEVGQLREHAAERLPDYMVPSAYMVMTELPRTLSGKLDRRSLPEPDAVRAGNEPGDGLIQGEVEEMVAGIWRKLLKIERLRRHDNFFQIGGHSLLATQLLSRVRDAFAVDVPLRALFDTPTIRSE